MLCPYLGRPVERRLFEQRTVEDMGDYLALTGPVDEAVVRGFTSGGQQGLRMKSKMVLQDPFELNRNVSGGFGESGFKKFMYYCDKAQDILDNLDQKKEEDEKVWIKSYFVFIEFEPEII